MCLLCWSFWFFLPLYLCFVTWKNVEKETIISSSHNMTNSRYNNIASFFFFIRDSLSFHSTSVYHRQCFFASFACEKTLEGISDHLIYKSLVPILSYNAYRHIYVDSGFYTIPLSILKSHKGTDEEIRNNCLFSQEMPYRYTYLIFPSLDWELNIHF